MTRKEKISATKKTLISRLERIGIKPTKENSFALYFDYNGHEVVYYLLKNWFSGRGVEDGRGIDNLINQLSKGKQQKTVAPRNNDVISEYWIIDRDLFRSLGKVNTPIMQSSDHAKMKSMLVKIPNGVLTLTKFVTLPDGTYKVYYQQIKRNQ